MYKTYIIRRYNLVSVYSDYRQADYIIFNIAISKTVKGKITHLWHCSKLSKTGTETNSMWGYESCLKIISRNEVKWKCMYKYLSSEKDLVSRLNGKTITSSTSPRNLVSAQKCFHQFKLNLWHIKVWNVEFYSHVIYVLQSMILSISHVFSGFI